MNAIRNLIGKYSHYVSHNPYLMLILVVLLTLIAFGGLTQVSTKYMETRDMLPEVEVVQSYTLLENSFGTDTTLMIALEVNPAVAGSNEVRDIREVSAIRYMDTLGKMCELYPQVSSANSAASVLRQLNGGVLPKSEREIIEQTYENPLFEPYISQDYTMSIIRLTLTDIENSEDEEEIVLEIMQTVGEVPKPAGLDANVAGEIAVGPSVMALIEPDMAKTTQASFLGIIIISFLLFRSIRYGSAPLLVIGIGIVWAMGLMGLLGIDLSSETSGVISMIMGIGIDFGIQITSRYREELKNLNPNEAMEITLNNVFVPMGTTTLAALIGFRAMALGQITIFAEFAQIMSIGIATCFVVAITLVPVILVAGEGVWQKIKNRISGKIKSHKNFFK